MKDVVDFETAVRLKEAGFPQPSPEVGQFWHSQYFGAYWLCVVAKQATKPFTYLLPLDVIEWGHQFGHPGTPEDNGSPVFAPSITDLLLAISTGGLEVDCGMFSVWTLPPIEHTSGWSAPEELANAWIELKGKK